MMAWADAIWLMAPKAEGLSDSALRGSEAMVVMAVCVCVRGCASVCLSLRVFQLCALEPVKVPTSLHMLAVNEDGRTE